MKKLYLTVPIVSILLLTFVDMGYPDGYVILANFILIVDLLVKLRGAGDPDMSTLYSGFAFVFLSIGFMTVLTGMGQLSTPMLYPLLMSFVQLGTAFWGVEVNSPPEEDNSSELDVLNNVESKPTLNPNLFYENKSDKAIIEEFMEVFDNSYAVANLYSGVLFDAEVSMMMAIYRCKAEELGPYQRGAERAVVNVLRTNYRDLIKLETMYNLSGAINRLNSSEGESSVNNALAIYKRVTDSIIKCIDSIDLVNINENRIYPD